MTNRDLLVDLARVRVIFQMRALAAVMGLPETPCDRDGAAGGDANAAPVPKDRQARADRHRPKAIAKTSGKPV